MLLRLFEHSQVYHPERVLDPIEVKRAGTFEDVYFKTEDGHRINGWFFAARPDAARKHLCMLVCHGNAGNISHRVDLYNSLLRTGVSVFAFDYRGYGRSAGRPSEEGTYLDGAAAIQWLRTKEIQATEIIAFGESLGGGIGSELANRFPLAGLVLQSTFTSIPDIGAELFPWLPVKWLATIKYDTFAKLPRISCPVMVIHSRGDGLAAFHHSEKNFGKANEPKLFWETKGDHGDMLLDQPHFVEGMEKFMGMVERQQKVSGRPVEPLRQ
jgi:fermentation-respiration switch protein FrsA (DUF1100 family)